MGAGYWMFVDEGAGTLRIGRGFRACVAAVL